MRTVSQPCEVLFVGKENVGKTQLIASLSGCNSRSQNFRGSTVSVEYYRTEDYIYIDTPGILRTADTETTRMTLNQLTKEETVLLVIQATHLDHDLRDMLPLLKDKCGAVVVTFWDKIQTSKYSIELLKKLTEEVGVPFIPVNTLHLSPDDRLTIKDALTKRSRFAKDKVTTVVGWQIEPKAGWFEDHLVGPILSILLLALPAGLTIYIANGIAERLDPIVRRWFEPIVSWVNTNLATSIAVPLAHDYGLLEMGPFLFVWALPTVLLYALILGVYKTSGLMERLNTAIHPLMRPFGLSGRDIVRVMMGLGCNVPAVISTRSCSSCSRGPAIAAIAFGAACSYQLPATLAVFAAAKQAWLIIPFLGYLVVTTLIYLRFTSSKTARSPLNVLMTQKRAFMEWPRAAALRREAWNVLRHFFTQALPIFLLICISASFLAHIGTTDFLSELLRPMMAIFNLPLDSSLPVIMASIRKDGIFLFVDKGLVKNMNAVQLLTGVYMAGVLLPCLVTVLTICREQSWKFTGILVTRQVAFALLFSLILAWGGTLFL